MNKQEVALMAKTIQDDGRTVNEVTIIRPQGEGLIVNVALVTIFHRDRKGRLLLSRPEGKPWSLPACNVAFGEHPDRTAARLLHEGFGCGGPMFAVNVYSRFFENPDAHFLLHVYLTVPYGEPKNDANTVDWFDLRHLPEPLLDGERRIIVDAWHRLRGLNV